MQKYQGEYPVIFVNFKNVNETSYQKIVQDVKRAKNDTFKYEYFYKCLLKRSIDIHNQICGTTFKTANQGINCLETIIKFNKIQLS